MLDILDLVDKINRHLYAIQKLDDIELNHVLEDCLKILTTLKRGEYMRKDSEEGE